MDWKFEKTETEFKKIPVGKHRVRIEGAEEQTSSKGNDMIKLTLAVSGQTRMVWHYIVFMADKPEITNQKLTAISESFGIDLTNGINTTEWIGKVGAAMIKLDENEYEKVNYFIPRKSQDGLPSWVEPSSDEARGEYVTVAEDELPF